MYMKITFKNDIFKKRRGASKLLALYCRRCETLICYYQKDGKGGLFRLYVDRIYETTVSLSGKELTCCNGHTIAVAMIYEKEHRPAFRLFGDSIRKQNVKSLSR